MQTQTKAKEKAGHTPGKLAHTREVLVETTRQLAETKAQRDLLLEDMRRIAYEPQGEPTASHAEVLQAVENIARAAIAKATEGQP